MHYDTAPAITPINQNLNKALSTTRSSAEKLLAQAKTKYLSHALLKQKQAHAEDNLHVSPALAIVKKHQVWQIDLTYLGSVNILGEVCKVAKKTERMLYTKHLREDQFERIEEALPGYAGKVGRPVEDNRRFVEGVIWVGRNGGRWRSIKRIWQVVECT